MKKILFDKNDEELRDALKALLDSEGISAFIRRRADDPHVMWHRLIYRFKKNQFEFVVYRQGGKRIIEIDLKMPYYEQES